MILVVSSDSSLMLGAADNLRTRLDEPVLAAATAAVAIQVLEHNRVPVVVALGDSSVFPAVDKLHALHPELHSIVLVDSEVEVGSQLTERLPERAFLARLPADWDAIAELVESRLHMDEDGVIANGVTEILGLVSMTRANVVLEIRAGAHLGHMWVREGVVVGARCEGDDGHAAAFRMLAWENASVKSKRFEGDPPSEGRATHLPIPQLVHEAARRADEIQRLPSVSQFSVVLDRLAQLPDLVGIVLYDSDNGTRLTERGVGLGPAAQEVLRPVQHMLGPLARSSQQVGTSGAVVWESSLTVATFPVGGGFVLAIAVRDASAVEDLRSIGETAAAQIAEQLEAVLHNGESAPSLRALAW